MQKQFHNVLDTDKIVRLMVKMTLPILIGMGVQAIYNAVDTIFIGHFVGRMGMAGLSIAFPLQMLTMGVVMMAVLGGASLISRLIGRGDKQGAEHTLGNGIIFGLFSTVVLMAVFLPFIDFWLKLFGASEAVLPFARNYAMIMMIGAVTIVMQNAFIGFARAE